MPYGRRRTAKHRGSRKRGSDNVLQTLPSAKKLAKGRTFRSVDAYNIKPEPFPRVLLTRCKYANASASLTTSVQNVSNGHTYRLNSIWDPYYPAGGTTVVGHTQLAQIYGKYWVMGAKVTVTFNNPNNDGARVGCRLRIEAGTTAIGQSVGTIAQQPNTYMTGLNDSGSQVKKFNFYVNPWTLCGCSKLEYLANSDRYASNISADPVGAKDSCLMDVFMVDNVNSASTIYYNIKIEYFTKLYSRMPLTST